MTKLSDTQRVILSRAAQHEALLATPPAKLPAAARQAVLRSLIGKALLEEVPARCDHAALGWRQDEDGAWIALRITAAGLAAIGIEPAAIAQGADEPQETAIAPAAPQEASLAAFPAAPPLVSGEAPEGPQRPTVSRCGPIGRTAALRMAVATVLAAWDAPERGGLDDALGGLRDAMAGSQPPPRPTRDPAAPRQPRTGTKQEAVLALLRRDEGTTIAEIIDATGWQPHTVRGFLAGLKRKGMTVEVLERVRQVGPNKQGAKGSYSIYRIATDGSTAPADDAATAEAG
jgi:hypothetical protein